MRDPLVTRKIFAKIDREADLYVVCDRLRQAVSDLDDDTSDLGRDIKLLQIADKEWLTKEGVRLAIEAELNARSLKFGGKMFWIGMGIVATVLGSGIVWLFSMAYKGMQAK